MEGGAWRSEIVGAGSSLTLPNSSYYTDGVITIASFYRWVELVRTEVMFIPASFHVGSSWVAFGRNQCIVTSNDVGFTSVNDIINGAGTRNFEYDEEFKMVMHPSQFAK